MNDKFSAQAVGVGGGAAKACAAGALFVSLLALALRAGGGTEGAGAVFERGLMSPPSAGIVGALALALGLAAGGGEARARASRALAFAAGAASLLLVWQGAGGGGREFAGAGGHSLLGVIATTALAGAILGLDRPDAEGRRPTHLFAVFAAMLAIMAGLAHLYHTDDWLQLGIGPGMEPDAALAAGLLALGVLLARRGPGALQVLTSEGPGGVLARRLLPWVVLLPPGLDALRFLLEHPGRLDAESGQAVQTTLVVIMLGGFLWRSATRVNHLEERRRASEAALRESERRAREMVESLPQLVWTCTPEGPCDYLSPQWIRYTGRPESEQLGYGWLDQLHPDDRQPTIARWHASAARGESFDVEFRIRRHDGAYRWFKTRAEPLRDADGRIRKWFGTNTDIDEQRRAEEELRRARDELEARVSARTAELELISSRLQAAMEVAALGVWEWSPITRVLTWDATLRRIYGVGADEPITYQTWYELVVEEEREAADAVVRAAIERRGNYYGVFRIRRRDGSERVIESLALVLRSPEGEIVRMVGVNRDITDARAAEERLRTSEALLSEFVRHVPAAIAMFDRDMRYLRASERWMADFKLGDGELTGRSHYEVFPHLPAHWLEVHRRVLSGAVESREEEAFPQPDGGVEWLRWEARPWRGPGGEIGGLLLFSQLITRRKRLELDLERQRAELERSNRDLEQFAYVASHDLQEPLRAVSGCVQLLQRRHGPALDPQANELIGHAVDGARRMQTLIHDLLTFSRVGTGGLRRRPTPLAEPLADALRNLRAAIEEAGAEVTQAPDLPELPIDRERVAMLFQNLVGNAIKYRAPGRPPRVHVGAERAPEGWVFSVRDNGVGIDPRHFERIFVIFQRLHTRDEYPGTGIGLALCKKIVERHEGRIWVESRPGEGSVFRFTLSAPHAP